MSRELLLQLSPDMCAVDDHVLDGTRPIPKNVDMDVGWRMGVGVTGGERNTENPD